MAIAGQASASSESNLFTGGDDAVGTTWQYQYFTLQAEDVPVENPEAEQELCAGGRGDRMVRHLDDLVGGGKVELHVPVDELHRSADVQAQIMQWFGEAPAQSQACRPATVEAAGKLDLPPDPKFCDSYHAGQPAARNSLTPSGTSLLLEDATGRL